MPSITVRRCVILLYLLIATFFVAHSINAFVAHSLTAMPLDAVTPPVTADSTIASGETPIQFVEQITHSGLFQLPAQAFAGPAGESQAKPARPPLNIGLKLRLLGTMLDARGEGFAVVEDIASKRQNLVRLREIIENVGEVSELRREGILIRQGDQEEVLGLALLQSEEAPPPSRMPAQAPANYVSPAKRTLDRREVVEAVKDPSKLLLQAHAVPYIQNGAMQGFRLDFVNPSGFFDKAGFQYGDVIQRINGVEIRDPGRLLGMFNQVVNERTVKVDVVRAAQNTTLTYELR
ncbi:MAG: PDZ domain-containing protein [Nitrospira sp.]|nr:PDZ domain-containing protein [Nitrospira sp.]